MDLNNTDGIVSLIVGIFGIAAAVFERLRNVKTQNKSAAESNLLSDAKMFKERADSLAKLAEDNLKLYNTEHADHQKTREFWHTKAGEFQDTLSACQEKLTDFQSRPDFNQVVKFVEQQAETSAKILGGIEQILTVFKKHVEKEK